VRDVPDYIIRNSSGHGFFFSGPHCIDNLCGPQRLENLYK